MAISTNKEYITATLEGFNLTESDVDLILLKASLNGGDSLDIDACDNAIYNKLSIALKCSLQNIRESGYSIDWNIDALKLYYNTLCNELGKPNVLTPKIRNRSNLW